MGQGFAYCNLEHSKLTLQVCNLLLEIFVSQHQHKAFVLHKVQANACYNTL